MKGDPLNRRSASARVPASRRRQGRSSHAATDARRRIETIGRTLRGWVWRPDPPEVTAHRMLRELTSVFASLRGKSWAPRMHRAMSLRLTNRDAIPAGGGRHGPRPAGWTRLGLLGTTGNPITWGHLLPLLDALDTLDLDAATLLIHGAIRHKPAADAYAERARLQMARRLIRPALEPLVRFSDLGSGPDSGKDAEEILHLIFQANPDRSLEIHSLTGFESWEAFRAKLDLYYTHACAHGLFQQANRRLVLHVVGRFGAAGPPAETELQRLSAECARQHGAAGSIPVRTHADPCAQWEISSTAYRRSLDPRLVPAPVHRLVRALLAPGGPGCGTATSAERFLSGQEARAVVRRLRRRTHIGLSPEQRRRLVSDLQRTPLRQWAKRGLAPLAPGMDAEEAGRIAAGQEASFWLNAAPLASQGGSLVQLEVRLDPEALERMRAARERFQAHYPELLAWSRRSWDRLPVPAALPSARLSPVPPGAPAISLCVPCLSARLPGFVRRLEAMLRRPPAGGLEIVVVLADAPNLDAPAMRELSAVVSAAGCPGQVLCNPFLNRIGVNRNLAFRQSHGECCVFADDDVSFAGPVLERLAAALGEHPELGLVSVPSYDVLYSRVPRWTKPRWHNLKLPLPGSRRLTLVNLVPGMVMATRREIARVLPFPSFWPNTGEDYLFSEQVNRLGFLNAYLSPEDGWAEHAGLASQSDPANPQTFPDMLCNSVLGSWLAPGTFDDLREGMTIFWLRRYFGAPTGFQECRELWRGFRDRALAVLEGDDHAFAGPGRTPAGGNAWQERRPEDLSAVLQRLRAEKESILEFKRGEFPGKDLAGLRNACLGPLSYAARSP